jgi:hypothetical protein
VQYGGQLPKIWSMTEVAGFSKMLAAIHQTVHLHIAYQEPIFTAMKNTNQKSRNFFMSSPPEQKHKNIIFLSFPFKN